MTKQQAAWLAVLVAVLIVFFGVQSASGMGAAMLFVFLPYAVICIVYRLKRLEDRARSESR